jgi:hypothetical protein
VHTVRRDKIAATEATCHFSCKNTGAPSATRTHTVRILSPLPLPIGLWGRRSSEAISARFSHAHQVIAQQMAVAVQCHRRRSVPEKPLHDLDVSARPGQGADDALPGHTARGKVAKRGVNTRCRSSQHARCANGARVGPGGISPPAPPVARANVTRSHHSGIQRPKNQKPQAPRPWSQNGSTR